MGCFQSGLKYEVLFARMDRMKLSDSDYEAMFLDVQQMEFAALEELNPPTEASNV